MSQQFRVHDRLSLVPDARVAGGPRVCLAAMVDAQQGILTAEWFSLRVPFGDLVDGVSSLRARAVTGPAGPLGIFDFDDVPAYVVRAQPSLAELRRAAHRQPRH